MRPTTFKEVTQTVMSTTTGVRDLTPHVSRIIYFHVIKVNINKA